MGIRGEDLKLRKTRCDKQSPLDMVECKDCRHTFHRHNLSRSGLCDQCGARRVVISIHQLQNKRGNIYRKWMDATRGTKTEMKGGNHGQENDQELH